MKSITFLIIIVICVGVYFVYIGPTTEEVKSLSLRKAEYNNILNKTKELKQKREAILKDYNNISEEDIVRLNKIIPERFNPVSFVNDINTRVSRYGMAVRDFKADKPRTEVRDTSISGLGKESYRTTTASFRLIGQYSQFVEFLEDLESSLRLIDVIGFTIRPANIRVLGDTSLEYSLEINTYSLI